jgi:hypothetical protein
MKKQIVCYTVATNAMGMEQKRAENIRKQFLDMLDNASNNLYNGNRGRNFEDVNYDKTSEEKYSRDVDYQEFYDLKRENKHTNEVQSIDVLYAVNEKITALFLKNKRLFFALFEAGCLSDKPFVYIFIIIKKLIKYIVVL